jgi:hypothetical protein
MNNSNAFLNFISLYGRISLGGLGQYEIITRLHLNSHAIRLARRAFFPRLKDRASFTRFMRCFIANLPRKDMATFEVR